MLWRQMKQFWSTAHRLVGWPPPPPHNSDWGRFGGGLGSGGGATTPPRHGLIGWPTMSDGEGWGWGGGRWEKKAGVEGRCQSTKYTSVIQCCCSGEIFSVSEFFLLMTIADSPRYTHKTSGFKTSVLQNVRFQNVRFQNVMFTKHQVYKTSERLVSKRPVFKFDILIKQKV